MKKEILMIFFILISINSNESYNNILVNISISQPSYYFIQTSEKLSSGVFFTNYTGALNNEQYQLLPGTTDNNATWNYNKTNMKTEYWILSYSNGVYINICQGAVNHLCSNANCSGFDNYIIPIDNVKWSSSFENNANYPSLLQAKKMKIGFDNNNKIAEKLNGQYNIFLRYWLSVPPNTPPYNYNTTYQIKVVVYGYDC